MDSDEIHELYLRQQISAAKNQLIVSITLFAVGLIYNLYQVTEGQGIDAFTLNNTNWNSWSCLFQI